MSTSETVIHASGAQRSADVDHMRFDLIHPIFAERVATVMAEGAGKYGAHNWEQGFGMDSLFNHLIAHIFKYLSGDRSEDHLGHAACNIMFLIVESEMRYEKHAQFLRDPGCQLSKAQLASIEQFNRDKANAKAKIRDEHSAFAERIGRLTESGTLKESAHNYPLTQFKDEYFPEYQLSLLTSLLEKFGFHVQDAMIMNVTICKNQDKCCQEATPVDRKVKLDCATEIQSLITNGVLVKSANTSVSLRLLVTKLEHKYSSEEIEEVLTELIPRSHCYDHKTSGRVIMGIGINPRPTTTFSVQPVPVAPVMQTKISREDDPIDSIRDKLLAMFVSGELRYWGGTRIEANALIRHVSPVSPDLVWHAFNTIGFKTEEDKSGTYIMNMEWKPR